MNIVEIGRKKKQEGKEEREVQESQEMISKRCRKENRGTKRKSERTDVSDKRTKQRMEY